MQDFAFISLLVYTPTRTGIFIEDNGNNGIPGLKEWFDTKLPPIGWYNQSPYLRCVPSIFFQIFC